MCANTDHHKAVSDRDDDVFLSKLRCDWSVARLAARLSVCLSVSSILAVLFVELMSFIFPGVPLSRAVPSAQNYTSVPLLLSVFERLFMSIKHFCHNCLFGTAEYQEVVMLINQVDLLRCAFDRVHVGVSVCVFYCLLGRCRVICAWSGDVILSRGFLVFPTFSLCSVDLLATIRDVCSFYYYKN